MLPEIFTGTSTNYCNTLHTTSNCISKNKHVHFIFSQHVHLNSTQRCSFSPHKHVHFTLVTPSTCLKLQMVSSSAPMRATSRVRRTGNTVPDCCRDTDEDKTAIEDGLQPLRQASVPSVRGIQYSAIAGCHEVFVTLQVVSRRDSVSTKTSSIPLNVSLAHVPICNRHSPQKMDTLPRKIKMPVFESQSLTSLRARRIWIFKSISLPVKRQRCRTWTATGSESTSHVAKDPQQK